MANVHARVSLGEPVQSVGWRPFLSMPALFLPTNLLVLVGASIRDPGSIKGGSRLGKEDDQDMPKQE